MDRLQELYQLRNKANADGKKILAAVEKEGRTDLNAEEQEAWDIGENAMTN